MDGFNTSNFETTGHSAGAAVTHGFAYQPRNAWSTGLVAAALFGIVLLLLTGVFGCMDRTSLIPNSDPALRKTKTEFCKDAIQRQYHAEAPHAGKANGRAMFDYDDNTLQIANFSPEDWKDIEVWVNRQYVVFLPRLEGNASIAKTIDFEMMYDQAGRPFPTQNNKPEGLIQKVEIYQGGKFYEVTAVPAD